MQQSSATSVPNPAPLVSAIVPSGSHRVPAAALHFGSLLLARRIIAAEQLDHALSVQLESPYLRIGEILLGLGYISFAQLRSTLEDQYQDVRLGELLLQLGIVTPPQIEAALERQQRTGLRLGPALIELEACSEAQIYRALASQDPR
ncbi:MAG TPA: hypothetical protein V6D05_02320 [Stenomitos sp.]